MEFSQDISYYYDDVISYNHRRVINSNNLAIEGHLHDIWELIFLKEGDIEYTIEGNVYHVTSNSLILTPPNHMHFQQLNDSSIYDRFNITFDAKILLPYLQKKIPKDLYVITFEKPDEILKSFEKMDYYFTHFEQELMRNMLHHLIEETLCNVIISDRLFEFKKENVFASNKVLLKAIEYIKKNLDRDFSLDELCSELFISKGYLNKLFTNNLSISPKKYIVTKRLMKAQQKLHHNKKPMEIYAECGFSDYSSFYRSYKKLFGYPPSAESFSTSARQIRS